MVVAEIVFSRDFASFLGNCEINLDGSKKAYKWVVTLSSKVQPK